LRPQQKAQNRNLSQNQNQYQAELFKPFVTNCLRNQKVENINEENNESFNDTLNDASEQLIFDINETDDELQTNDNIFNKTNKCIQIPRQPYISFSLKKGHKFQFHWFNAYPWLDYQMENDSVFCFVVNTFLLLVVIIR
jgi:hypothetical protein